MHFNAWTEHQERKMETVKLNQETRAKRSPEEQLDMLDKKLGKGIGAKKERSKLLAQIKNG